LEEKFGQIRLDGRFGRWIALLAGSDHVTSLLEIGTWKGMGSTALIARALEGRTGVHAVSIESNVEFHKIAQQNLKSFQQPELIWGSIVSHGELDEENLTGQEPVWLQDDLTALEAAPVLKSEIPDTLDFLLLDGGEFSSWAEFMILLPRLKKFVLLDDTFVRKNRKTDAFLRASPEWLLIDSGRDRNGWSVWLRTSWNEN